MRHPRPRRQARARAALLPLASLLLACSTPPPPPAAPAPAAAEPPGARVLAVEPSREGFRYARAKIEFSNPGPRTCRFVRYKILWGSWSKEIKLEDVSIPAGQTRERWIKVDSEHGDISALTVKSARVEVTTDCGG